MNIVNIIGRLTKDIELKKSQAGMSIISFSLAVDNPVKQGAEKTTSFIPCTAFDKTADNISKYFHKGNLMVISGRLQQRTYQAKDGTNKSVLEVVVQGFDFLEKKEAQTTQTTTPPPAPAPKANSTTEDDDLPF